MTFTEYDKWYHSRYRRTSSALTTTIFVISDLLAVMCTIGWGFFWLKMYNWTCINFKSFVTYWPYLPVFIILFQIFNLYPGLSLAPAEELKRFTIGSYLAYGGIILSRFIENREWDTVTVALIISCVFSTLFLLIARNIAHKLLYVSKLGGIPAVIYGSGDTGKMVVDRLLGSIKSGYLPALILDDDPNSADNYRGIPIMHDIMAGPEIVKRYKIKMAIVAMPKMEIQKQKHLLNYSVSAFRYNVLIPDFFSITNIWMSVRDFDGILGFVTSHRLQMIWSLGIKRFMDLAIVIIGGIILLPFLLIIALLVKLSSPGPVLYKHKRLGMNGKHFTAYKFRSMVLDSEERLKELLDSDPIIKEEWEKNFKLRNDPRITAIGKFLRRTSFDEFPQLINILKGEMSLVGPRPIIDEEIEKYGEDYKRIFSVKPGLTGLWQVSGRSDTNYDRRVSYDMYYLQSWSVWLDIWVLLKTFGVVFKGRGAY